VTNIASKGLGHIGDGVLEAAGAGGISGAISGALTAGLMKGVGALVPKIARGLLQGVTNRANAALSDDPSLAANFLSRAQYAVGQRLPWVAKMNYGIALESMVADQVENSPLCFLYTHMGNANIAEAVPDFVGRGLFSGLNFDITTNTSSSIAKHLARSYGDGLNFIFCGRDPNFTVFP
jgi:hypothetical protein